MRMQTQNYKDHSLCMYVDDLVSLMYLTNFPQILANLPLILESLNFAGQSALWIDCKTKNFASGVLHFDPGMKIPHLHESEVLLSISKACVDARNWKSKTLNIILIFLMVLNHLEILNELTGCLLLQTFILLSTKYKENPTSTSYWTTTSYFQS